MTGPVTREGRRPLARRAPPCTRRRRGGLAAALVALAAACGGEAQRGGVPPRHVFLVTIDTFRADRTSLLESARATTDLTGLALAGAEPGEGAKSLEQLAGEGVVFARAFAPRGQTFPSVATLFTGRPPLEHGSFDNRQVLCAEIETLAETFRAGGFATAAFTTNKLLVPGSGIEQGFDRFLVDFGDERDERMMAAAVQWLARRDLEDGPPVFLWLHLMGPHLPYDPAPLEGVDYAGLFTDPGYDGPADGSREWLDAAYADGTELAPADVEQVRALYDGELARVDHVVARFVAALSGALPEQPVDLLEESVLVVAGDHGEELHQRHGYWAHSKSVYDSVLRVPLFLRHPRSLLGRRVFAELVTLADVMPTLLDWFDLPLPAGVRGRSLLPLVDGGPFPSRPAFATWSDRILTVRTDEWRLVVNPLGVEPDDPPRGPYPVPELALFHLPSDPRELSDVADRHPEVVAELEGELERWRRGLDPLCHAGGAVSAERRAALEELGYLLSGEDP